MGVNENLTRRDVALGGKIRCEGCGGEWWLSGPQAEAKRAVNDWPTKCGNHPDVPVTGGRNDCLDETELLFVPYDVAAEQAAFRRESAKALLHAEAITAEAKKLDGGTAADKAKAGQLRAEAANAAALARERAKAADAIPEAAARILADLEAKEAAEAAANLTAEELEVRLDALTEEV